MARTATGLRERKCNALAMSRQTELTRARAAHHAATKITPFPWLLRGKTRAHGLKKYSYLLMLLLILRRERL